VFWRLKMMEMDERGCKTWLKDEREWVWSDEGWERERSAKGSYNNGWRVVYIERNGGKVHWFEVEGLMKQFRPTLGSISCMRATEKRLGGSHSVGISSLDALPATDWTGLERSTGGLSAQGVCRPNFAGLPRVLPNSVLCVVWSVGKLMESSF
jgi:hypothetical protein